MSFKFLPFLVELVLGNGAVPIIWQGIIASIHTLTGHIKWFYIIPGLYDIQIILSILAVGHRPGHNEKRPDSCNIARGFFLPPVNLETNSSFHDFSNLKMQSTYVYPQLSCQPLALWQIPKQHGRFLITFCLTSFFDLLLAIWNPPPLLH